MGFSTKECASQHTSIKLLTRSLVGLRGFEFTKTVDKEAIYGAGNKAIDIQSANEACKGTLKLLKYEVDLLNEAAVAAGYKDILEVPHEAIVITCTYKKRATDPAQTITAAGVAFTELGVGMDQGAKFTEISLPFLAMDITFK